MSDDQERPADRDERVDRGLAAAFGAGREGAADERRMGSVLRALQDRAESSLVGVHLDAADSEAPMVHVSDEAKALREPSGRYQMLGEIGRGGVGIVFKGRDQDLGRDVAMKVLKDDYANHPEVLARFVEEAQIGGQLQHPGIVPVYELGLSAGERPYFAMKLVKGETLAAQLAVRDDAAHDRRRLLGVFEQVCQTMAYAHARNVVHRDLKPANVMIGAFGEVQVVDWGFAKVLPKGGVADEVSQVKRAEQRQAEKSVIETVRSKPGSGSESVAGSMLGTPAYMPPEQALGDVDALDQRSDVFGLGAILCEILTGEPPYRAADGDLVRQAARAELGGAHDRLHGSGADEALVELAVECLTRAQVARPASAREVAERVAGYLTSVEERARDAELRAVQARSRQRMTALVATVAIVLLGTGVGMWGWWQHETKVRHDAAVRRLSTASTEAGSAFREAQARGLDADAWRVALGSARAFVAGVAAESVDQALESTWGERAAALFREVESGSRDAEVERSRLARDAAMHARLEELLIPPDHFDRDTTTDDIKAEFDAGYMAAFASYLGDLSLSESPATELLVSLQRGDLDLELATTFDYWAVLRDEIEAKGREVDPALTRRIRRLAAMLDPDNETRNRLRDLLDDGTVEVARLDAFAESADYRELTADGCRVLAIALARGDAEDAALTVISKAQELYPGDFQLYSRGSYIAGSKTDERLQFQLESLRVARALRPESSEVRHRQVIALQSLERWDEALAILEQLLQDAPERRAHWLAHRGIVLRRSGQSDAAKQDFAAAIAADPVEDLALARLCEMCCESGDYDEGERLARQLVALDPENANFHNWLGVALRGQQRLSEARQMLERAAELDPADHWPRTNLARIAYDAGERERAVELYSQARELAPDHLDVLSELGNTLAELGRADEAEPLRRHAYQLAPDVYLHPLNLGGSLNALGRLDEAREFIERAIAIDPDRPEGHFNLAVVQARRGQPKAAVTSLKKFFELGGRDDLMGKAYSTHVGLLMQVRDLDGACAIAEQAIERMPDDNRVANAAGTAFMMHGRLDDALSVFERWTERRPNDANALLMLGNVFERKGDFDRAQESWEECVRIAPGFPNAHVNLGRVHSRYHRYRKALAAFEEAKRLFAARGDPFSRQWAKNSAQNAAQARATIARLHAVLVGTAAAEDAREWSLTVLYGVRDNMHDEIVTLTERTLAEAPEQMVDQRHAGLFRAAAVIAERSAADDRDAAERARLRDLARRCLEHCVETFEDLHATGDAKNKARAGKNMRAAIGDSDFDSVRGAGIDQLPEAEREAWRAVWAAIERSASEG